MEKDKSLIIGTEEKMIEPMLGTIHAWMVTNLSYLS